MKILSMKTTIFLGAMLSLLVCLMFTGCSNSETNSTSRGLTDFAHIEEEYLATIDSLNWPDGITLPDKLEDEDTGASFQVGYGETRASYLWEYVYEEQKNETTRAMAAANLAVYNELFDNYKVAIEWVDKSLSLFEKRVDSNASDITVLRDYRRQLMERKSDNSLLQKQM